MGYMVTSEGIQANPKKTKALIDMQSPRTLKEMQSLSGKLAALNRFLARSAERSLPFFDTLKNITKENKDEYRWTEEAENSGDEETHSRLSLHDHSNGKRNFVRILSLLARSGECSPSQEAERNYALVEKLALSLLHMSPRLRRYFKVHPIKDYGSAHQANP